VQGWLPHDVPQPEGIIEVPKVQKQQQNNDLLIKLLFGSDSTTSSAPGSMVPPSDWTSRVHCGSPLHTPAGPQTIVYDIYSEDQQFHMDDLD